jgi:1,4-dihydroxy-2-naphthoate octaprenyltransferase
MANRWILGARIRTLPAAIGPVLVATVIAGSQWRALQALLALIVSLALQVGVNYANDYSDGVRGTDDVRVGPTRLTASGLATPREVKRAAFISFFIASVAGLVLAATSSWWIIAIGIFSIAAAWGYTGGKNPYGYKGLGEISVFIFFGVVATVGTFYVQTREISWPVIAASVPMGSLSCALLVINNIRDREQDEKVGKMTLAVRLGDKGARWFYVSLIASTYLFAGLTGAPWAILTIVTAPLSIPLCRAVLAGAQGAALIPLLAKTGKLQLLFSLVFALSLFL